MCRPLWKKVFSELILINTIWMVFLEWLVQKKMSNFLRIPLFFAFFILLGLSFGFLTFKILSFSRTVEVPALANMTLLEANEALSKKGLYLKIEGEDFDPDIQAGRIIRRIFRQATKSRKKRAIRVAVSKGPRISSVPLLVNEQLSDAEASLCRKVSASGKSFLFIPTR